MELYNEENAPPTVLESFGERIERLEGEVEKERDNQSTSHLNILLINN